MFKKTVLYLENFHFTYNAILASKPNKLEKIYSAFAIALRKSRDKEETQIIIKSRLIDPLEKIFPSYEEFRLRFVELTFSKDKENATNIKAKYVINRLHCLYSGKEVYEQDGSIEHLVSETTGGKTLNIGNLILLELSINTDAGDRSYTDKISFYRESQGNL